MSKSYEKELFILSKLKCQIKKKSVFSDLEVFAAVLSAAIHDMDHPGLTNQYLINKGPENTARAARHPRQIEQEAARHRAQDGHRHGVGHRNEQAYQFARRVEDHGGDQEGLRLGLHRLGQLSGSHSGKLLI